MLSLQPYNIVAIRIIYQPRCSRPIFSPPFLRIDIAIRTRHRTAMNLFDQIHQAFRVKHYSLQTEETYGRWIERFLRFQRGKMGVWIHPRDMTGRTPSLIGSTVYGFIAAQGALWYQARGQAVTLAEQSGQQLAVLSIAAFLVLGIIALLFVNEKRDIAAAEKANEP